MIDPTEKQTQPIALEQQKRGRGRPETGAAMTPAEKQKAYRERQKAKQEELEREMHNAYATIQELKKGNVTENTRIGKSGRDLINSVFEVAEATEDGCWRIQRKSKANGEWKTQQGSYWNQAKAEDALIDMPQKKGSWWRVIEVKSDVED